MTTIDPKIERLVDTAERDCAESFARLDRIERHNTRRVLRRFPEAPRFGAPFCADHRLWL